MATPQYSKEVTIKVLTSATGISSSQTNDNYMTSATDITEYIKSKDDSGGDMDVDTIKLFGYNEMMNEKRATIKELKLEVQHEGTSAAHRVFEELFLGTRTQVGSETEYRIAGGEKSSGGRPTIAIGVYWTNGTQKEWELYDMAKCTDYPRKLEAEGYVDGTITIKCLASTYYNSANTTVA